MMIREIERTVRKYALLNHGETVLIALSGGADSCALLLAFWELARGYGLKLIVAHFNHRLRGAESDEDEAFCRRLAGHYGLVFVTESLRHPSVPRGTSPEDYFRRERYRFLDRAAADYAADKIALGHHRNDQVETVLMNFLRGSGLDGLRGILPMRQNRYIRPLIEVSREEILSFLKASGQNYREDVTNNSRLYLRNRIRSDLIPYLKEKYNPGLEENLARMAEIIRRDDEFLDSCVSEILLSPFIHRNHGEVSFSTDFFKTLHAALGYRLLKTLLEGLAPEKKGFSYTHISHLAGLVLEGETGKALTLPHGLGARKEYHRMVIFTECSHKTKDYEYVISVGNPVEIQERKMILMLKRVAADEVDFRCAHRFFLDGDKVKGRLIIRNRRRGDWFLPLGAEGSQKIKKLFIDRKIPRAKRGTFMLLVDEESVLWIERLHLSERVKVTPETKNILMLEIAPEE